MGVEGGSAKFQSGISNPGKLLKTEACLCSMTCCGNHGWLDFIPLRAIQKVFTSNSVLNSGDVL